MAEQSAARNTYGARQVKCSARYKLIGTPRIEASEKADMTAPKARPRRLSGTTSATMVKIFAATTPPRARRPARCVARSEGACRHGRCKTGVQREHRGLAVEAVDDERGEKTRQARRHGVDRNKETELGRR